MNLHIIAVGKIREKFIKAGTDEFVKRIQPYSSLKITEIEAESIKHESLIAKNLEIEGEKILNLIPDSSCVIALDLQGKALSSEEFSDKIKELNCQGVNQVSFIIGGMAGLSKRITKRADFTLSLSRMTFPHQLARLFLLEQIYRAFKIINNEPYHK